MITDTKITIEEARNAMRPLLTKGTICPCCNQNVRQYSRTITSSMAYGLILLYHESNRIANHSHYFIHIETFFKSINGLRSSVRGDIPKLRFWNLIRPEGQEAEDGNPSNGMYKITELGNNFIRGLVKVPKHVKIYNNHFFGYDPSTGEVSIEQCLKNTFNYRKLMEGEL